MHSLPSAVFCALLGGAGLPALAQARPSCPARPQTLAAMRGCYRPLLVFAPSPDDPRLAAQRDALDAAADDMMDRFVLLVPITADGRQSPAPLDAPYAPLPQSAAAAVRRSLSVPASSFKVVLLGEDGGAKLESREVVSADRLDEVIDRMPTRKREAARPHAN